jgi:hypothetical protein
MVRAQLDLVPAASPGVQRPDFQQQPLLLHCRQRPVRPEQLPYYSPAVPRDFQAKTKFYETLLCKSAHSFGSRRNWRLFVVAKQI